MQNSSVGPHTLAVSLEHRAILPVVVGDTVLKIKEAQSQLAGVVAEVTFDPEFRMGSSVDEIVFAFAAVNNAAAKLRCDVEGLWLATLEEVLAKLKADEEIVRSIAAELMLKQVIKKRRIADLLRAVKRQR
jgi:hypothetical protein